MPSSAEGAAGKQVTFGLLQLVITAVLLAWAAAATGFAAGRLTAPVASSASGRAAGEPQQTGPFTIGARGPIGADLLTLQGSSTHLAIGRKATVVIAMATWCMYCGYMDRWVVPQVATMRGVRVDIVDVSPSGGIADPGPPTPPFHGSDAIAPPPVDVAGMEAVLHQYMAKYHLQGDPGVSAYVAPQATQAAWKVTGFPTVVVLNAQGTVVWASQGGMTLSQLTQRIKSAKGA